MRRSAGGRDTWRIAAVEAASWRVRNGVQRTYKAAGSPAKDRSL
jgi:hypothetical protein